MVDLKYFVRAKELNKDKSFEIVKNEVYFRGNMGSISLISSCHKTPQLGEPNVDYEKILKDKKYYSDLLKIIKNMEKPKRETPEKELQAWMIQKTFEISQWYLPIGKDIKYITSEFAYGKGNNKIVVDIIGLNENKLVVIELKSERKETELIKQITNFENNYRKPEVFSIFKNMIWELERVEINNDLIKIIVWPNGNTSKKEEFKKKQIQEITYDHLYKFNED